MEHKHVNVSPTCRLIALCTVTAVSLISRFYKLNEPEHVCWDETHFGKMASFYINRTFFFDVHPPLGKMLIGLSGRLTGYDGTFPFEKPGDEYKDTSYMGMRSFCALLGSAVASLSFLTVLELTQSIQAGLMASSLIIFDTGCIALSQYILLDPILFVLHHDVYILFSYVPLPVDPPVPVTLVAVDGSNWHLIGLRIQDMGIILTDAKTALTSVLRHHFFLTPLLTHFDPDSVKFVGLFVIVLAGMVTTQDLWRLLGDLSVTKTTLFRHVLSRVACLIFLPVLVYIIVFAVHIKVLYRSGNGDAHFSSHFQSSLLGNSLYNASMPKDIAYGSVITLRNNQAGGGLLHSHEHLYPEGFGPKQQQVTTYSHKDHNNQWLVKRPDVELDLARPVQFVTHGDFVRLEHVPSARNLHSHEEPAPLTRQHYQVSGYGINGTGDMNDIWRVEVVSQNAGSRIRTVLSKIKLVHYGTGCVLYTTSKQLPKWGWEQQEVACNPDTRDSNSLWNVEDHVNPRCSLPSFLEKLFESHVVMLKGNSGLKPKEGEVTSQPWQWPIDYRGQWFSGGPSAPYSIYFLGNPIIFLCNLIGLAIFLFLYGLWSLSEQRGCAVTPVIRARCEKTLSVGVFLFIGWLLHYAPFYAMGRVLYFHHYFPAMIFNSMLTGVLLDFILQTLDSFFPSKTRVGFYNSSVVISLAIILHSFYLFHPLSYGITSPSANVTSNMAGLHWMDSWEF